MNFRQPTFCGKIDFRQPNIHYLFGDFTSIRRELEQDIYASTINGFKFTEIAN
jgi:hypothetical protein